jgi:hypothetical protein
MHLTAPLGLLLGCGGNLGHDFVDLAGLAGNPLEAHRDNRGPDDLRPSSMESRAGGVAGPKRHRLFDGLGP